MSHARSAIALVATAAAFAVPAAALAAANPSGTGQPSQSCEDQPSGPAGFQSGGFANAETRYAGNGVSADHAGSDHAVSQYDVACFQVSRH